ncbi:MAG: hypothetical protein QOH62_3271 [Solirubrobacteraceae bacterium]|jgi:hypothetical protein|nr:hypothetical protein [Solirubrobacteraceae bacterium]
MAQTKRKRRTKHRGNAAGGIEVRGRTGRKPTEAERKTDKKLTATQRRDARLNKPPTWAGAAQRAVFATVIFVIALLLVFKEPASRVIALSGFILLLYIPMGYYTDLLIYRRRQAKKAQAKP